MQSVSAERNRRASIDSDDAIKLNKRKVNKRKEKGFQRGTPAFVENFSGECHAVH